MYGKSVRRVTGGRGLGWLLAGGAFGAADAMVLAASSRLGVAETFLAKNSPLGLSIAGYRVLLLSVVGVALFAFNTAFSSLVSRVSARTRRLPVNLLTVAELIFSIIAVRVLTVGRSLSLIAYGFGLAAAVLVFWAAGKALMKRISCRFAIPVGFLFLGVVIGLPYLADAWLRAGSRPVIAEGSRPNVLIIVLDTVRADALSAYNPEMKTTPNIERFAREGRTYLRAISPAPWTLPAHASMFTGLYPSQHGAVWENRYLDDGFLTLAECLSDLGYRTAGFVENPFVSADSGLAQGFRDYHEMYAYPRLAVLPRLINRARQKLFGFKETREYTRDTLSHFETWLLRHEKDGGGPFFAFLNFMSAHLPNYPRPGLTEDPPTSAELRRIEPVNEIPERFYLPRFRLSERELEGLRRLYLGDIAYLDAQLGGLFEFLRARGILDDTIVIVTSDHGENFGDHGLIEHQFCLYNSVLHVPLIVRYPRLIEPGRRSNDLVSTISLFRSVLDWTGSPDRPEFRRVESESLARPGGFHRVYAEHEDFIGMIRSLLRREAPPDFDFGPFDKTMKCVFDSQWKLIWSSTGARELYSLGADWQETTNCLSGNESVAGDLMTDLRSWQKNLWRMPREERARKFDPATEEALRSLGYIR
jgi:arylsulfatase A-like enzyme